MKNFRFWFLETRPQFLTLSIVLAFLGTVVAWYDGYLNLWHALIAGIGLIIIHASVNIFNDYFDFRSGVDLATKRTPFSGGSGILPAGKLTQRQVLWLGIGSFALAVPIGVYFIVVSGIMLLPLLLVAGFLVVLYSPLILRHPWPEWAAGAGLGALPILGLYFVQTGMYTFEAFVASIPPALLVHNLLFLNEFPDVDADKIADRRTMPIAIGKDRSAVIFSAVTIAVYVWIIVFAAIGTLPLWTLLGLLSLPFGIKAIHGALHHGSMEKFMPGMAANVIVVQLTQVLMAVGFIIDKLI